MADDQSKTDDENEEESEEQAGSEDEESEETSADGSDDDADDSDDDADDSGDDADDSDDDADGSDDDADDSDDDADGSDDDADGSDDDADSSDDDADGSDDDAKDAGDDAGDDHGDDDKGSTAGDNAGDDAKDADDADDDAPAPAAKTKKKRKKKTKKKKAASFSSKDAPNDGPRKKKTKKKKKPASTGPRAAKPRSAKADDKGEDDNTLMLGVGAVIVAVLAVGVVWYMKNGGDEDTTDDLEVVEEVAPIDDVPPTQAVPDDPGIVLPRPEAQPAPPDVAAPPENAERTESGLASRQIEAGTGEDHPGPRDRVTVHYTGWTTDGEMFDSSRTRGRPATFPLNGVIAGWTEGVQLMVAGEKRRFWIPANLAYEGRPGPQGTLVFDIELISFEATPEPPETPSDVAAPPANAQRTESGLASRVLREGTGDAHPAATDRVSVHYSGWTTDGEMFDSSVTRGRPATFPLNGVIPGWTEGVQLMVVGERRRFWIPENLAYAGRPGAPQGMLVFDVELLEIL